MVLLVLLDLRVQRGPRDRQVQTEHPALPVQWDQQVLTGPPGADGAAEPAGARARLDQWGPRWCQPALMVHRANGVGVPIGGTTGQILAKIDATTTTPNG